jgi:hypothetical protein
MPSRNSRKAAIQDFKDRSPDRGVYAVRCVPDGRVWVGASPNLGAAKNGLWFQLRAGVCRDRALQEAWTAAGEEAFTFEVLERLDDDVAAMRVSDLLKQGRERHAREAGASVLL